MERGYKLKYNDKWMAIRRQTGFFAAYLYDDEHDPNVDINIPLGMAKAVVSLAEDPEMRKQIEIIDCGELKPDEANMTIKDYLTRRIIRT